VGDGLEPVRTLGNLPLRPEADLDALDALADDGSLAALVIPGGDHYAAGHERLIEALEAAGRKVWLATQVVEDPNGDHDWRLVALVDLAECDREERAVVHLLSVGPQD